MFGRRKKRNKEFWELVLIIDRLEDEVEEAVAVGRELEKQRNDMTDLAIKIAEGKRKAEMRAARLSHVIVEQEALIHALERRDAGEQL